MLLTLVPFVCGEALNSMLRLLNRFLIEAKGGSICGVDESHSANSRPKAHNPHWILYSGIQVNHVRDQAPK